MRKLTQEEVRSRLLGRRIKLLGSYKLSTKRCRFKCLVCGCKWKALAADVINRFGCPECSRKRVGLSCRLGLEEIKRRTRKLKSTLSLLSKEYVGTTSPLKFQCGKCGKKVSLSWESLVRSEGRCAACTWSAKKLTLKEIKERLKKINPNLKILGKYKHSSLPLRCECKVCHVQFSKPWNDLRQRITACSCRRVWSGEEEVRRVLEGITGWVFPKGMPSSVPFLNGLSLDGYNEEHRIGYEFQGAQHYQLVNFGGSKDTWRKLRRRKLNDKKKRVACLRHGVLLLVVPYWKKDVEGFLKKKLKEWRKRR